MVLYKNDMRISKLEGKSSQVEGKKRFIITNANKKRQYVSCQFTYCNMYLMPIDNLRRCTI